jgi:hypothetical protein
MKFLKTKWFLMAASLVAGAVLVFGIRFFTYQPPEEVHYHANFALYLNGQREEFKDAHYYTEVEMCTGDTEDIPTERAHMHDEINNVVHVEDNAVTWGNFFENLGWTLGPNFIAKPDGMVYQAGGNTKLHIMLNGQDYTDLGNMAGRVIKDKDRLLISFGEESNAAVQDQYRAVPTTAEHYDNTPDPASCSGGHGGSMSDRLKHMF